MAVQPGGGDNCFEDCLLAVVGAVFVAIGVVVAAVGLIVLGPVAALAVTAAVALAALLVNRSPALALAGGVPGILAGVAAIVVGALALRVTDEAGAFQRPLDPSQPGTPLMFAAISLAALAGPTALIGALGADAIGGLFVTSDEDAEPPPSDATTSRLAPRSTAMTSSAPMNY